MGKVLDGNGYHPGLAVSPDGARLYETTNSPKLHTKVWQLADHKHLADLECDEPVIHPNGKWLVHLVDRPLDNGDFLRALDAATGREVKEFKFYTRGSLSGRSKDSDVIEVKPKIVPQLAFNHSASVNTLFTLSPPDGNLLAFVGSARATDPVRLLVVSSDPSGKPVIQLAKPDDPLKLPAKILFTPDGKRLVGLSHPEYGPLEKDRPDVVRVWQVSDAKVLVNVKIPARASDFALSPDGHWIALGCGDGQVRLLATATGAEVLALKGHTRPVSVLAFSNDGKMLAAGSEDGTVRVWKAE